MLVILLAEEGMSSLLLPDKIKGKYWVQNWEDGRRLIGIESIHAQWVLCSNEKVQILDGTGSNIVSAKLSPCSLYSIREKERDVIAHLFTEPTTEDWKRYIRYTINGKKDISIGRSKKNSVCIRNIAVSATHARLLKKGSKWAIYDKCSTNGINTYIYRFKRSNGKSAKKLATGRNPIVIGKYIYYVECRQYGDSSWKYMMDDYLDSILIYFSVVRTK